MVRPPPARNGIDTDAVGAVVRALSAHPDQASCTFRATNRWVDGVHSRTTMAPSNGPLDLPPRPTVQSCPADRPRALGGTECGPMPIESLLHAVAACLTATVAEVAARAAVELVQVETAVAADVELGGAFGIAGAGRPGCREIRLDVRIVGDAPAEAYAAVLGEATRRSPVLATLTDGVPVVVLLHTEGTA